MYTHPQAIQYVNEFVSSSRQIWITCSPVDPLQVNKWRQNREFKHLIKTISNNPQESHITPVYLWAKKVVYNKQIHKNVFNYEPLLLTKIQVLYP